MYTKLKKTSGTTYRFSLPKSVSVDNVLFFVSGRLLAPNEFTVEQKGEDYELTLLVNLNTSGGFVELWGFFQSKKTK